MQCQIHASAEALRLITFDADGTLYADGHHFEHDNEMIQVFMTLMKVHRVVRQAGGLKGGGWVGACVRELGGKRRALLCVGYGVGGGDMGAGTPSTAGCREGHSWAQTDVKIDFRGCVKYSSFATIADPAVRVHQGAQQAISNSLPCHCEHLPRFAPALAPA